MPTEQKEVEELLSGKTDLTYTVSIEVVPSIQLADFKSFSVEKPVVDVTEADVDEAIKRIADQSRPYAAKERGRQGRQQRPRHINFKGPSTRRLRRRTGEGNSGRDRRRPVHPGLRGAAHRHGVGETRTLKVSFPKELRQRKSSPASRPNSRPTATAIEAPGETEITTSLPKRLAWNRSTS